MARGLILLVDDDADFSDALTDVLTDEGYGVVHARNGLEALEWLKRGGAPDVILLDLMMPVMDGFGFRERQLSDPAIAAVPVVAFTAGAHSERTLALRARCLCKPLDIPCLLDAIRQGLPADDRAVAPAHDAPGP